MASRKQKTFASAREIIRTYFPGGEDRRGVDVLESYARERKEFVHKLADELGSLLEKGLRR